MKKLILFGMLILLGACSSAPPTAMPFNVAMLPNDCQNRQAMISWLDGQARIPQQRGESTRDYTRSRNAIREKIWGLRYHCQSV
jgi:hypothetical protein